MSPGTSAYIGRFAPSPSGALHFGSLLAALASFLDARACGGQWLLRMEDLDPAREPPGAADQILYLLEHLGLHWDGPVVYQSERQAAYADALEQLREAGLVFPCDCTRKRMRQLENVYDGHCRKRAQVPEPHALRLRIENREITLSDQIQGCYGQNLSQECGDFIIRRKDGLIAYQLAVVVDDAWQNISHIVRGFDLLDSTPRQLYLQEKLGLPLPRYAHIPVASDAMGQKLSKQHFARPLDQGRAAEHIHRALEFLGQAPPPALQQATVEELLAWGIEHWDIHEVPRLATIPINED